MKTFTLSLMIVLLFAACNQGDVNTSTTADLNLLSSPIPVESILFYHLETPAPLFAASNDSSAVIAEILYGNSVKIFSNQSKLKMHNTMIPVKYNGKSGFVKSDGFSLIPLIKSIAPLDLYSFKLELDKLKVPCYYHVGKPDADHPKPYVLLRLPLASFEETLVICKSVLGFPKAFPFPTFEKKLQTIFDNPNKAPDLEYDRLIADFVDNGTLVDLVYHKMNQNMNLQTLITKDEKGMEIRVYDFMK